MGGRTPAASAHESPELYAAFVAADPAFRFPGGEALRDQVRRTCVALRVIASGLLPALVVGHVGTIRAALAALGADGGCGAADQNTRPSALH